MEMCKLYHVDITYAGVLDGIEFWLAANSLAEAWKDVCSMGVEADIITIRETDTETVAELIKTVNEG